ncbi:hypothetical protein [Mesorhizobium sp. M1216]|uniref:hypothetical protein n=1 Tax=Mesorhizobium sp. M1216 TaxID=2957069 RepID=UPI00333691D4
MAEAGSSTRKTYRRSLPGLVHGRMMELSNAWCGMHHADARRSGRSTSTFLQTFPERPAAQSLPMRKEHPMSFTPLIAPEIKARYPDFHLISIGAER